MESECGERKIRKRENWEKEKNQGLSRPRKGAF